MRNLTAGLAVLFFCWMVGHSTASAEPQAVVDPVLSAYHDYQSAEDRGDWAAAEADASRALAASEARDGDNGATAALAMNLAVLRMEMDQKAAAIGPARQALELAQKGAKGVDELAARLMIGEAELSVDPKADEAFLLRALRESDARSADIDVYAYPAAIALEAAAAETYRWSNLRTASLSAQRHIDGAPGDRSLALAGAMMNEGMALASTHDDRGAYQAFDATANLLRPLAPESADGDTVSLAEMGYANAVAWRTGVLARQLSDHEEGARTATGEERAQLADRARECPGHVEADPPPVFPNRSLVDSSVGAVVVRIQTDGSGKVVDSFVLAAAPSDDFRQAVKDPHVRWFFRPAKNPPAGCRLDSKDRLQTVLFWFQ